MITWFAFSFDEPAARRLAITLNGCAAISRATSPLDRLAEPLCYQGTMGFPIFDARGNYILILSGPFWHTLDTIRVWDTRFKPPLPNAEAFQFSGSSAPPWLADLAEAITGVPNRNG